MVVAWGFLDETRGPILWAPDISTRAGVAVPLGRTRHARRL